MLGQNCRSKSLVEFAGRIHGSNSLVKLLAEIMDQIPRSNLLVKSAGQMQAILGPTLAGLGARMAASTDSLKTAKD